jgi:hypothetical protein
MCAQVEMMAATLKAHAVRSVNEVTWDHAKSTAIHETIDGYFEAADTTTLLNSGGASRNLTPLQKNEVHRDVSKLYRDYNSINWTDQLLAWFLHGNFSKKDQYGALINNSSGMFGKHKELPFPGVKAQAKKTLMGIAGVNSSRSSASAPSPLGGDLATFAFSGQGLAAFGIPRSGTGVIVESD